MSNRHMIKNEGNFFQDDISEHLQEIPGGNVTSVESESASDDSEQNRELVAELVHIPWHEEFTFQDDVLQATDTITFDRVFTKRARPTQKKQTKKGLEQLLTPWGLSALSCFLVANGLLTWSYFSQSPSPTAIAFQSLPNTDPNSLINSQSTHLNLANPDQENLNLENLSRLQIESPQINPVVANLPPVSPPVATVATIPDQVPLLPQVNNSLANALLPPSLQPQTSAASRAVDPVFLPSATNPTSIRLTKTGLTVVNPPVRSVPTVAVNPSYSAPRSISTIPLPPPTQLIQTPIAPPVSSNTSAVTTPEIAPNPVNSTASEQISNQITNLQNNPETNSLPTATEGFNQKTRMKLQKLYNQSQGVSTNNSEPTSAETNSLIQQLQQLNQPE